MGVAAMPRPNLSIPIFLVRDIYFGRRAPMTPGTAGAPTPTRSSDIRGLHRNHIFKLIRGQSDRQADERFPLVRGFMHSSPDCPWDHAKALRRNFDMQKLFIIAALTIALPVLAQAQEAPRTEFFGGYSYMRLEDNGIDGQDRDLNGYNVSGAITVFKKYLSLKVDVSGHFGDLLVNTIPRVDQGQTLFLGGPQVTFRNNSMFQPFAHALFGAVRRKLEADATQLDITDTGFAFAVGGGIDVRTPLGKKVAVRLFQADYVRTRINDVSSGNLRASAGIVLRFGTVE
jgi:hypothetical protein